MADRERRRGEATSASSHRLVFALCAGALTLAVVLGGLEALWPAFAMENLPVTCAFRRVSGMSCPGCGLTRSWVALGRGAVEESLALHRLGWVVMIYVFLQAVRHGLWLWAASLREGLDRGGWWLDRGLILLAVALFTNWGLLLLS